MSASTAAQPGSEHAQILPSSDQSNDPADGLSALALAGHDANLAHDIALPGIGLPLNQYSALPTEGRCGYWYEHALPVTVRERVMIAIMATLKDKPDWERKVFDDLVVGRWRAEALAASSAMQAQDQTSETATTKDEQTQPREATDPTSDYNAPVRQRVVTKRLFQYCIDELREQAASALNNNFTEVVEATAAAYISDEIVSLETKMALRSAVAPLEDVPDDQKDWHPGSDGKVLDLVHPSLFPLMYGKSKYPAVGKVSLQDCANYTGQGDTVSIPTLSIDDFDYSTKHQWLPCEVLVSASGEAEITSYINNLHPDGNEALYAAIEQVISDAIPMWKAAVRSTLYCYERPRLIVEGDGYDHEAAELVEEKRRKGWQERRAAQSETRVPDTRTEIAGEETQEVDTGSDADDDDNQEDDDNEDEEEVVWGSEWDEQREAEVWEEQDHLETAAAGEGDANVTSASAPQSDEGEEDDEDDDDYVQECFKSKYIKVPEPGPYESRVRTATDEDATGFEKTFAGDNLQVIVKLANIHLTPKKPNYDGGSWHIEGLPNEHICASALYYYDSSNVTESYLAFRETDNQYFLSMNQYSDFDFPPGPEYEQDQYDALIEIYGLNDEKSPVLSALQVPGKVLTREGRLLVFPNVLQHRVLPFKLADPTKPGHRKLLALFLVDPNIKIPSTANIPPQQRQHWAQKIDEIGALSKLPPELRDGVYDQLEFPLSMEQAKRVREELMEERKAQHDASLETWQNHDYTFCEH